MATEDQTNNAGIEGGLWSIPSEGDLMPKIVVTPFNTTLYAYNTQANCDPLSRRLWTTTPLQTEEGPEKEPILQVPAWITVRGSAASLLQCVILDTDNNPEKSPTRAIGFANAEGQIQKPGISVHQGQQIKVIYPTAIKMEVRGTHAQVIAVRGRFNNETGEAEGCVMEIQQNGAIIQWQVDDLPFIPVYEGSTIRSFS